MVQDQLIHSVDDRAYILENVAIENGVHRAVILRLEQGDQASEVRFLVYLDMPKGLLLT